MCAVKSIQHAALPRRMSIMSNIPILKLCNEWVKIIYRTKIDDAYRIRVLDGSTHCVNNET